MRKHHRGYRITPFSSASLDPEYIFGQLLKYKKDNFIRGWYNTVLGEPYEGGTERLGLAELLPLFTSMIHLEQYDANFDYFIGVDVGTTCHIVIGKSHPNNITETKFVHFETINQHALKERVKFLVDTYHILSGNMDKLPEQVLAKDVKDITHNVILPTIYGIPNSPDTLIYKENDFGEIEHCVLQRTRNFDELVANIRTGVVS